VNRYLVAIVPTNEFFEGLSWVFEGGALPGEGEEITVKAVENVVGELVEESAVVLVSSVAAAETFPITAAPL
jgi:hypothetical protein